MFEFLNKNMFKHLERFRRRDLPERLAPPMSLAAANIQLLRE
jgi:hypothetical protein